MSIHPDLILPGFVTVPSGTNAVIEALDGQWYHSVTEQNVAFERTFVWPKGDPRLGDERMCPSCKAFITKAHELGYYALNWPQGDEQASLGRTWALILEEDLPSLAPQLQKLVN